MSLPPFLRFAPAYFERIWGGTLMRERLGFEVPTDRCIGEAWLISDHPQCESVVVGGAYSGASLRALMREHGAQLMGKALPAKDGRFPLLLKLIDAGDLLSVQVHPDDSAAARLGEPDGGKTEMWHVIHAEPGAQLVYGLHPGMDRPGFEAAVASGKTMDALRSWEARPGMNVFVPAGTVHAIGAGILLAEIQQNSDITYRIHDFDRRDAQGNLRALHLEKALEVMHFGEPAHSPEVAGDELLAESQFFTARRLAPGAHARKDDGTRFHIYLGIEGASEIIVGDERAPLGPGESVLVPAATRAFTVGVAPNGKVLEYFVP